MKNEYDEPIFMRTPNKYGNIVNINHPKVKPIYEKYKRDRKILIMSDNERTEFETKLINWLKGKTTQSQSINSQPKGNSNE